LSEISQLSRRQFPNDRRYHIPHNLYHEVQRPGFSPSLHQITSFSVISRYRLVDWLTVFGFCLDDISRLQAILPTRRTSFLDSTVYDGQEWIPWFEEIGNPVSSRIPGPLTQWLEVGPKRRADSFPGPEGKPFLYVKIGCEDDLAFPDLLPGSIVRVDRRRSSPPGVDSNVKSEKALFLVQHSKGLVCCRLRCTDKDRILLCAERLPYAQVELVLGREAHILGVADMELRPLMSVRQPEVPADLGRFWIPGMVEVGSKTQTIGDYIQRARRQAQLSFREASERSRVVARLLGNDRYFFSPGTLSDYETMASPPRHVEKIISLCIGYSVKASDFLAAAGLHINDGALEPMPDNLLGRSSPTAAETLPDNEPGFLHRIAHDFGEIPLFLREAWASLGSQSQMSIRDVFWMGSNRVSLHPYLKDAILVSINRRNKKPRSALSTPLWEQPFFMLLTRDGNYLCASCTLERDTLVIQPFSDGFVRPVRFHNSVDVEVIGQVVTLVRRLSPNS
jgi:transcriptional regulator with XRE-family HTH domain